MQLHTLVFSALLAVLPPWTISASHCDEFWAKRVESLVPIAETALESLAYDQPPYTEEERNRVQKSFCRSPDAKMVLGWGFAPPDAARQRDFGRQERRGAAEADSRAIAVRLLPTAVVAGLCGKPEHRPLVREPFPYREGGGLPVSLETTRAECTVECSSLPCCYGAVVHVPIWNLWLKFLCRK